MSEKDLNTLFDEAFTNAQFIPQESVPQDLQLVLYGFYKQATSETSNAWMQVKHLQPDDAKIEYINIINKLLKERKI